MKTRSASLSLTRGAILPTQARLQRIIARRDEVSLLNISSLISIPFSTLSTSTPTSTSPPVTTRAMNRAQVQPLRGTKDLFPDETRYFNFLTNSFLTVLRKYGYFHEIRTPILEHQSVFESTLGDTSDVVMKQMYAFDDSGVPTVLRPENTAGVVRAILHRGPSTPPSTPVEITVDPMTGARLQPEAGYTYGDRLYYMGPMFRRERPQAGRLRQFTQFGVESLGSDSVGEDVAVLMMADEALRAVGIRDGVSLKINSLGDSEDRERYRAALGEYYDAYRDLLSEDSLKRLDAGVPERILDSKSPQDKYVSLGSAVFSSLPEARSYTPPSASMPPGAPTISDYLSEASSLRFQSLMGLLSSSNIQFEHDKLLFRGLDYYCHTAFEFVIASSGSSAKTVSPIEGSAVLAGGRYNNLSTRFAARTGKAVVEMAGIGWAAGFERIFLHLQQTKALPALPAPTDIAVVGMTFKVKDMTAYHRALASLANDPMLLTAKSENMDEDGNSTNSFDGVMNVLQDRAKTVNEALGKDKHDKAALAEAQALVDYASLRLTTHLRTLGLSAQSNTDKPFRTQLAVAMNQLSSRHVFIIGTDELASGIFSIKDSLKEYIEAQSQVQEALKDVAGQPNPVTTQTSQTLSSRLQSTTPSIGFTSRDLKEFVDKHYV